MVHFDDEASEEEKVGDGASNSLNVSFDSTTSKRGRPPIPDQWSGITLVDPGDHQVAVKIRPLASDLLMENAIPAAPRSVRSGQTW